MNAAEGHAAAVRSGISADRPGADVDPPGKPHSPVEEEEAVVGIAGFGDQKAGEGPRFSLGDETAQVDVGKDIHVIGQERLPVFKEGAGEFDAAARLEGLRPRLARNVYVNTEIAVFGKETLHLVGKMEGVYHYVGETGRLELEDDPFQHGHSPDRHKRLGDVVSERFQPGTEAGGEDKSFHTCAKIRFSAGK